MTTTGTNSPRAPTTAATVAAIAPVATMARNDATSTLTRRDGSGNRGERASPWVGERPLSAIASAPALWLPAGMRRRYRHSLIVVPVLYLVAAILLGLLVPELDQRRDVAAPPEGGIGTARDILTATATGMIAFTGFVLASVLVVVQFAAGQYSPRLVLWFRRDALTKHAIGCFLSAFIYALVALRKLEAEAATFAPDLTVAVALALLVVSSVLYLALLQRVTDRLRPRTLYRAVIREGIHTARDTYPALLGEHPPPDAAWATADPQRVALQGRPGVVTAFDRRALVDAATRAGAVIELVPGVGEFVGPQDELLRVHGGRLDASQLARLVEIEDERTIEQDPAFAMRIVVDTAIRALSPAINDPTTAVQALDVLEVLVRELAGRDLETSLARDARGDVRLVWRSPSWEDVLDLAFGEIRQYGAGALQICRRLRAVLEDLLASTPVQRHAAIEAQLRRLDATVLGAFPNGSPEL
jgi:uncharacterized membrane protein